MTAVISDPAQGPKPCPSDALRLGQLVVKGWTDACYDEGIELFGKKEERKSELRGWLLTQLSSEMSTFFLHNVFCHFIRRRLGMANRFFHLSPSTLGVAVVRLKVSTAISRAVQVLVGWRGVILRYPPPNSCLTKSPVLKPSPGRIS